jgi:hypothetical protein
LEERITAQTFAGFAVVAWADLFTLEDYHLGLNLRVRLLNCIERVLEQQFAVAMAGAAANAQYSRRSSHPQPPGTT